MSVFDHVSGLEMTAEHQKYLEENEQIAACNNVETLKRNVVRVKRRIEFLIHYYALDVPKEKLSAELSRFSQDELYDRDIIYSWLKVLISNFDCISEKVDHTNVNNVNNDLDSYCEILVGYENLLMKFRISSEEMEEPEEFEEFE